MAEVDLGKEAEALARAFLGRQGLYVLAQNVRTGGGELDLVAKDGETLVFVEVKGRSGNRFGRPEEYVDLRKQKRLASAAEAYLSRMPGCKMPCRFDVVAVDFSGGAPVMRHIKDAFRPGG